MELTTEAIAGILGARTPSASVGPVTGVSTDSRAIKPGDCFFAIPGKSFDGHQYVARAFDRGAACAVVNHDSDAPKPSDKPIVEVEDTITALGDFARAYRSMNPFKVVAITGSVGKTTTRQIVYHVLSRHFRAHQARKNFNNTIGLPLTLLDAEPSDEVIVAELGANSPGEISYLTDIAQPNVAVVTNAHPAHLEGFGSLETIIREKTAIADGLTDGGVFLINGDIDALVSACREDGRVFKTFGKSAACNVRAETITHHGLTSTFAIDGQLIRLPLPGPGNVENALAGWAVCAQFGLKIGDFALAMQSLPSVSMRAEPLQIGTLTVLNDCYNANPASMTNALAMLSNVRSTAPAGRDRRLVFVCGHMAELGAQTESLHAELGRQVAQAGVDLLLTVGVATRSTAETARRTATQHLQTEHFDDTISLCDSLRQLLKEDDIILVKGSRTARLEDVVQRLSKDYG
jgi:UDP-N-acetylmuramoyl-tripeptide--D-alanyl-D-alanine ligase